MKNFFLKTGLTLLCLIIGLGSAWGDTYTIDFNKGTTNGTNINSQLAANVETMCSSGYENAISITGTNCYYNSKGCGIRLAKSSGNGSLVVTFSSTIQIATVQKVIVYASAVESGNTMTVTPAGTVTKATEFSDLSTYSTSNSASTNYQLSEITINGTLTSLTFGATSKKYVMLHRIDVITGAAKTLSSIAVKTAPNKVTYTEGETFDPAGLVITGTYSDSSTEDIAYADHAGDFTFSPTLSTALTTSNTSVTITYGSKTTTQSITVNEVPKHTANFYSNGSLYTSEQYTEGAAITFPTGLDDINGKKFMGWVSSPIDGTTDTAPDFVTTATMGESDVTYYAVYATQTGSESSEPTLVNSTIGLIAGNTYYIAASKTYASTATAMGASTGGNNFPATSFQYAVPLTLGGNATDGWTFSYIDGGTTYYLDPTSTTSNNYLKRSESVTNYGKFSISFSSDAAVITSMGKDSRNILRYNSSNTCFACYSSGQGNVYLFAEGGGTSYSGYCTTIGSETPTITAESTLSLPASESDGTFNVTWTNVEEYDATLYADDACTSKIEDCDWLIIELTSSKNIDYYASANMSTSPRTVYMQLYGVAADGTTDATKVVTITQAGKQASDPTISNFIMTSSIELTVGADPYDVRQCLNIPSDYDTSTYAITTTIDGLTQKDNEYACVYPYLSFQKAGTYTVHVIAAAMPSKYAQTEGDITVTVTDPTGTATFTFNSTTGLEELGINTPAVSDGTNLAEYYYNGAILMRSTTTNGTPNRVWNHNKDGLNFRVYEGATLTFSGATITKIEITGNDLGYMATEAGEISVDNGTATWEGSSSSVVLNASGTTYIKTITVYYDPSSVPATYKVIYDGNGCGEAVTGTPTDNNDYTENASVTVSDVTPTREGYTFTGWNTKGNASGSALSANGTFSITANTVIYAQWTINSYTLTKGTAQNGSFTMKNGEVEITDNATIEYKTTINLSATPENGYKFVRYEIAYGEGQSFTKETAKATITMPAGDATVSAVFESLPTCAINWSVNGTIVKTENLLEGTAVTAPTDDEIAAEVPEGVTKVFTGWVTTSTVDADNTPSYVDVTTATATEAITYYAVFATESGSGSGDVYVPITESPADWSGTYIMVVNNKIVELDGNKTASMKAATAFDTASRNENKEVIISSSTDGYKIYLNEKKQYIGKASSNTSIKMSADANDNSFEWILTPTSIQSVSANTRYLMINGTNVGTYVPSSTYSYVVLYKYNPQSGTTYSDFTTQLFLTTITISKYGSTTLSLDKDYTMPEGLTGKIITAKKHKENEGDGYYTLTYVTKYNAGDVVPAGEALVIQDGLTQDESRDYRVYEGTATGEVTSYPDNLLCAKYTEDASGKWLTSFNNGVDNYYYKLTTKNGANFGWYWGNGGAPFLMTSKERAYLVIDKETASAVRGFALADGEEEDITTFIESLTNDELIGNGRIYNLQGLRQNTLQKGINIVNGKKVIR